MEKMSNIPSLEGKKRVVIVGGGFGGLKLATKLNPKFFQVLLLDKNNYHQFQPLLYQVAISGLEVSSIAYPFRKNFQKKSHIHFRMCEVTSILGNENRVETTGGSVSYDYLIIAAGCDTNFFGDNSLRDTTITLKTVSEALFARNQILQNFEKASISKDPDEIKRLMNFVIVGGGATGVELAGALADLKRFVLQKDYPELDISQLQIHLIDASPRLLFGMSEKASKEASKTLIDRGVQLHQGVVVSSYKDQLVTTSNRQKIETSNVLWVAGITPHRIPGLEEVEHVRNKRIVVDANCRVNGWDNVFAIGDISYIETKRYPRGYPQVAQVAIQMGSYIAALLEKRERGKSYKDFKYVDKGSLATIGRNAAVADIHQLKFGGRVAWWVWLWVHILSIVGVKNRLLVMINWAWSYVTYDLSLRLLIRPLSGKE